MPEVNLLRDTLPEDEKKTEQEKRKARSGKIPVTNPALVTPPASTAQLARGVGSRLRRVFAVFGRSKKPVPTPHILSMGPIPAPVDAAKVEKPQPMRPAKQQKALPPPPQPPRLPVTMTPGLPTPGTSTPKVPMPLQPKVPVPVQARPPAMSGSTPAVASTVKNTPATSHEAQGGGDADGSIPSVNLVPEELQSSAGSKSKLITLGFIAGITIMLIAIASVGMMLVQNALHKQAVAIQDDIQRIDQNLKGLIDQKRKAQTLHQDTLRAIGLLEKHIYWTRFLAQLEAVTVDTVVFHNLTADQSGRVTVNASGKDFRSVARQLVAFQKDNTFIKEASITSASAKDDKGVMVVDFTATLTLQDGVFYRTLGTQTPAGGATP